MEALASEPAPGRVERLLGPYSALAGNRNLSLLFTAQTLSSFMDWFYVLALVFLAYQLSHSATIVALITFMRLLPYAVLLPISGAITDRFDRKFLMMGSAVGRMACLISLTAVQSRSTLFLAFPLVFLSTLLLSIFRPAMLASLPAVVPESQLVQANGLMTQMDMISQGAGPALAGSLLVVASTGVAFLVAAAMVLASGVAVAFIRMPEVESTESDEAYEPEFRVQAGIRFLAGENEHVLLALALTLTGLELLGGAYWAISVVLAEGVFHFGSQGLGWINAAYGAGGLLAGFAVGSALARLNMTGLFIGAAAASSLAMAVFGLSRGGALPFIALFVVGVADVLAKITASTIVQIVTPRQLLGRVFGAFESALVFAMVLGSVTVGPLINILGAPAADVLFAAAGILFLAGSVPILLRLENVLGARVFLRQIPILAPVSFQMLAELADRVSLERVPAGTTIIRQGDVGDRFYVIRRGQVDIIAQREGFEDTHLATHSRMDYFGEIALLHDVPRTATVVAREPVELYSLSRADFQDLIAKCAPLNEAMTGRSAARDLERQSKLLVAV